MKLTVLMEDTGLFPYYHTSHGLSLHIELQNGRQLLFDFGDDERFFDNADKMGLDLKQVDDAFLSHGHYDHGGGLRRFLERNQKAAVHVQRTAFSDYRKLKPEKTAFVGLNTDGIDLSRLHFLDGSCRIGDIEVLSHIPPARAMPEFVEQRGERLLPDHFLHEQSIVLTENGRRIAICGCCHCGADAIARAAAQGGALDAFVGGFHLTAWDLSTPDGQKNAMQLARGLLDTGAMCYTCHCTGLDGYELLKPVMGTQLGYLSVGMTIAL